MFKYSLARAREVWSAFFPPNLSTMDPNPFPHLLAPSLSMDTDAFIYVCWSGVTSSPDPALALERFKRFKVKNVNLKKKKVAPEHEFVLITMRDVEDRLDRHFILERTADLEADKAQDDSEKKTIIEEFLGHQDCKKVLDAVLHTLLVIPPAIAIAGAAVVAAPALSAPAMASAVVPLTVASALLLNSSQVSSSDLPLTYPIMEPSTNSIIDHATLSVAQFFDFLSGHAVSHRISKSLNKPPIDTRADDRWLAGVNIQTSQYGTAQGARSFEAHNLNLFHMALLAHVVHSEYPLYSLFKKNCYWFSNLIYLSAREIDKVLGSRPDLPEDPEDSKDITDSFFLPFYLWMPRVAGCWMGFKICEVQKIVVDRIARLFLKKLEEHERKVCLFSFRVTTVC